MTDFLPSSYNNDLSLQSPVFSLQGKERRVGWKLGVEGVWGLSVINKEQAIPSVGIILGGRREEGCRGAVSRMRCSRVLMWGRMGEEKQEDIEGCCVDPVVDCISDIYPSTS